MVRGGEPIAEGQSHEMLGQRPRPVLGHQPAPVVPAVDALEQPQVEAVPRMTVTIGPRHRPDGAADRDFARDPQADQLDRGTPGDFVDGKTVRHTRSNRLAPRATAEKRQVEADLAVERFQRRSEVALAAERVEEARHEAEAIREKVIPGAEQTLREVRAGYNRGGFTFLDVSTAQSALQDARVRMVAALSEYHRARSDLDRLTGRFAELVGGF